MAGPVKLDDDDETRVSREKSGIEAPKEASLVQIYGPNLGERYILDKAELSVGRDENCDIVLDNENVSRFHARFKCIGPQTHFEDLGSTNGSLVNDREVTSTVLSSGDLVKIGSVMLKYLGGGSAEALYHEEIYRLTIHDGLTGVPNRRNFEDFLDREYARAVRYQRPLSLMLLDLDHFKHTNDEFGHLAGDYVLRRLAAVLKETIRREELLARYGGEEFVVVMPETEIGKAEQFAERIRGMIEKTEFEFDGRSVPVTMSVGVACLSSGMHRDRLVQAADEALYRAKAEGRNRVCRADLE